MSSMGWRDLIGQDVAREGLQRMPLHHAEDDGVLEFVHYFTDVEYVLTKCPVCKRLFLIAAEGCDLPEGVVDPDPEG